MSLYDYLCDNNANPAISRITQRSSEPLIEFSSEIDSTFLCI